MASFDGDEIAGLAIVTSVEPGEAAWLPGSMLEGQVLDSLRKLLGAHGRPLRTHDAKRLMRALLDLDVDVRSLDLDTEVAGYLLDPAESSYLLQDLLLRYVGLTIESASAAERLDVNEGQPRRDRPSRRIARLSERWF